MCINYRTHTKNLPWDWELFHVQNELEKEHDHDPWWVSLA